MSVIEKLRNEIQTQADEQDEVRDLDIEGVKIDQFTKELAGLFEKYPKLVSLAISDCQLKSLEGFPKIAALETLLLEANKLTGDAVKYITSNFKKLELLSLAENQIKTFDELQTLSSLTNLQQLDLSENPVASLPGYHKRVFSIIPSLKVLDNKDKDGQEIQYSDEDEEAGDDASDFDDEEEEADDDDEESEEPVNKKKVKK